MAGPAASSSDRTPEHPRTWVLVAAFAALALAIAAAGYLVYDRLTARIKHDVQQDLVAISSLKAKQIAAWVAERRANAEVLMKAPVFAGALQRGLAGEREYEQARSILQGRLSEFRRVYGYQAVVLFDADARPLLVTGPEGEEVTPHERGLVRGALAQGAVAVSDVHWEGAEGASPLGIDIIAPVFSDAPQGRGPVGAVLFKIDPGAYLFPLVQSWPTASRTAETMLVRVEGEQLVYVNELRHRSGTALRLRFPLENWNLAGAMILRRGNGAVEGVDYRGVPVLAAGGKIPGSDWYLIAKIDLDEIYVEVRLLAALFSAAVGLLIAAAGVAVGLWWRGARAAFAATRYRLELERGVLAERLDILTRHANDMIFLVDEEGRILDVNERVLQAYGYTREELIGRSTRELRTPEAAAAYDRDIEQVRVRGGHVYETVHRRKDGSAFPVEISGRFIEIGGKRYRQTISRDITERKRAESRIRRLNQLYAALSQTNEAIVRVKDRDELFHAVCRIAVDFGKLQTAWIALADAEGRRLKAAASHGEVLDSLDWTMPLSTTHPLRELAHAALARAQPCIANDLLAKYPGADEQAWLRRTGFRAAASFPLRPGGRTAGTWNVVAAEAGFFDAELEDLLGEMATDISFAIENFDKEAQRRAAEERLRKLSRAVEESRASILITDAEGRIEYVNPAVTEVTGYGAQEVIGKTPAVFRSGNTPKETYEKLWQAVGSGKTWRGELENRKKSGELHWEEQIISPVHDEAGQVTHFVAIREDVTERRENERRLRELNRRLLLISRCNQALVRARDEKELLQKICEEVVEAGGYRMCWVGFAEHDAAKSVRPAACAGAEAGFLESLGLTWDDTERGRGPVGIAIRTGKPAIVRDVAADPSFALWRAAAQQRGYASVAVLPLAGAGSVFGTLSVLAAVADAFDEQEMALLSELADDLAFGIIALRTAAEQSTLVNSATVGITLVKDRRIVRCNPAFARMLGYDAASLIGESTRRFFATEEDHAEFGRQGYAAIRKGARYATDIKHQRADGSTFWANVSMAPIDVHDPSKGEIVVAQDIDRRKRAERALRLSNSAVESSANGIMITDFARPGNPITYVNPAFERITGYAASEAVGRNPSFLLGAEVEQQGVEELRAAIRGAREGAAVLRNYRKDGSPFWNDLKIAPVRDASGSVTHFVGIINDITERKRYEEQLEQQANFDNLTGLANRNLMKDRVTQAIAFAARSGRAVALLFLDLDRFKRINDSLGHVFGDAVLRAVAERLQACVRERDTVARLGGDEFVIVLSDMARPEDVSKVAAKILGAVAVPLRVDGREIAITTSIGVSLYPRDGTDHEALLRNADAAMYQAKDAGRNAYRFYTEDMNARALEQLELEARLRRALERGELLLHYQPLLSLESDAVSEAEALLRWSSGGAIVSPAAFIPLAEDTGLIVPIGEWVMREACRQLRQWLDAGLPETCIAVNLSARQFRDKKLVRAVRGALEESALPPHLLRLEITESAVMHNAEQAVVILAELKALGVGIAVDDFGTGYSSLAYLKRFPIDQLKIDRSFVRDMVSHPDSMAIVQSVIGLAQNLRLQIVAEGVETAEQRNLLKLLRCDKIQGYLFCKPLPAEQFLAMVQQHQSGRAA